MRNLVFKMLWEHKNGLMTIIPYKIRMGWTEESVDPDN